MLTVTNSTFSGNSADNGGGIYNGDGGTVTVKNSTFSGNSAESLGGGILNIVGDGIHSQPATVTVTNTTFSGNSAGNGGGGIGNGGTLTLTNSTFTSNSTNGNGGGIANGGTLTVTNSTFSGNSGGSISNAIGTVTVTNTILANSTSGGNCAGGVTDGGHNIDDGTTCGFTGTGCTSTSGRSFCNTNPQLEPAGLKNNGGPTLTVALCTAVGTPVSCTGASPAINAGDESVCSTTTGTAAVGNLDQRGFIRPGTGAANCSIGAYEANSPGPPPCEGDCDGSGDVTADEILSLVNMALGNGGTCPSGLAAGVTPDVSVILTVVNNALNGCSGGPNDGLVVYGCGNQTSGTVGATFLGIPAYCQPPSGNGFYQCDELGNRFMRDAFQHPNIDNVMLNSASSMCQKAATMAAYSVWRPGFRATAGHAPVPGDLVVWAVWLGETVGHVAVVTSVLSTSINYMQQNMPVPIGSVGWDEVTSFFSDPDAECWIHPEPSSPATLPSSPVCGLSCMHDYCGLSIIDHEWWYGCHVDTGGTPPNYGALYSCNGGIFTVKRPCTNCVTVTLHSFGQCMD
ncbi:MAG: choice-of-anchor Q domain-containing protein [Candidatus Binatia bacterium]